jgi:phosphoribosyl-ATP pyrophosphohydrolase
VPLVEICVLVGIVLLVLGALDLRSDRGKLLLTGPEAKDFLHGQVTNDVLGLEPGTGCYAAFLDHKGKMQGDLRILDTGEELLLDTERGALQAIFNVLHRARLGFDAELHKRTLQLGLLSLIGPKAEEVARAADSESDERVAEEAADLLYHLEVLLLSRELPLSAALEALNGRRG